MSPMTHPLVEAPWGAIIGGYLVLVGLATGVTLIAHGIHPQDEQAQVRYAWLTTWVAFLALVVGSVLLVVDLGRPARFYLMVTSFSNLGSPMSIGAKLIALKLFLLAMYLYLLARRRMAITMGDMTLSGRTTRTLFDLVPMAFAVVSLILAVYPAVLLAWTWSSPLARTPASGVVFLSTALLMGTAVTLLVAWTAKWQDDMTWRERLRRVLLFLVLSQIPLLGLWLLSMETTHAPLATALSHLLEGVGAPVFWLVVIALGAVVPASLLHGFPGRRAAIICGALAVLVGASATRYLLFTLS